MVYCLMGLMIVIQWILMGYTLWKVVTVCELENSMVDLSIVVWLRLPEGKSFAY